MIEIGRLCLKTAGRDAGCKCVVVDILDEHYVLIDGETRRRKCNILHLEPLNQVIKIEKNASHEEVAKVLKDIGVEARQTKPKEKKEKPKKVRKKKEAIKEKEKPKEKKALKVKKAKEVKKEKKSKEKVVEKTKK